MATKIDEDEMEDSEDEGEELLKQVKDRKQSIAKLNMSPQEKDLIKRLSTAGEGNFNLIMIYIFFVGCSRYIYLYTFIFRKDTKPASQITGRAFNKQ